MVVDWSAAATARRGPDSIWIAHGARRGPVGAANPPTRGAAMDVLVTMLDAALAAGERVLVGVDVSFGYPAPSAAVFGASGPRWERPWRYLARHVRDTAATNANNRFDVADALNSATGKAVFFGRPPAGGRWPHLGPTRRPPPGLAPNPFPALRETERRARAQVGVAPLSGWHLYGGVSVGSQVLTALGHLQRLRCRYEEALCVWPQETGFADPAGARPRASVVLAELWPTALAAVGRVGEGVRDERQVRSSVEACRSRQRRSGGLSAWFSPASVAAPQPVRRRRPAWAPASSARSIWRRKRSGSRSLALNGCESKNPCARRQPRLTRVSASSGVSTPSPTTSRCSARARPTMVSTMA